MRDHEGIVGYRIHRVADIAAGPFHRHDDVTLAAVFDGDKLVAIRVLRDDVNGRPADAAARQQLVAQLQAPAPGGGFAVPFDARFFKDYRYAVHGSRVMFTSAIRDARHGDGFFDVAPDGRVTDLDYAPNALPRYASTGSVHEERAQVLPGFSATTFSREEYTGHYAIFSGHGEFITKEFGFVRFTNENAAKAWLQAERSG